MKTVYRGNDYRNPSKYGKTRSGPSPAWVAAGLAAFTIALALACVLGSLAPAL